MAKQTDTSHELPITIRPQKGSALARLANAARAQNVRGGLSEMVHGWADKHETEAPPPTPPEVSAFD